MPTLTSQELARCKELQAQAAQAKEYTNVPNLTAWLKSWAYYEEVHRCAVSHGLPSIKPQYWYDLDSNGEIISPLNMDDKRR
jgi:hypothetical protein